MRNIVSQRNTSKSKVILIAKNIQSLEYERKLIRFNYCISMFSYVESQMHDAISHLCFSLVTGIE